MLIAGATLTMALAAGGAQASPAEALATTSAGMVRGKKTGGVFSFKGVPYGKAGSALRFRPPEPPEPWTGVRDALEYATRCPDTGESAADYPGGGPLSLSDALPFSEDCLQLNIWTSALRDGGRRPVMVWLHGGGFHGGAGSNAATDGTNLVQRGDVVVVNVTHRLNAFGFLHLADFPGGEEYADAGNVGMLDIVQALKWIQDNIEAFGGDPSNVTIFGFSGGAGKVATLMAMPAAKGLFHRAICMSGSTGIGGRSAKYASLDAEMLMYKLGLKSSQLHELAALPMERLREGVMALKGHRVLTSFPWGAFSGRDWRPVVDGRSLKSLPWYHDAPETSASVPLLIGTVHDEVRMHIMGADPTSVNIPWPELEPRIAQGLQGAPGRVPSSPEMFSADEVISWYRKRYPDLTASELQFKIVTFWIWRHAAIWQAEHRLSSPARDAKTWMYRGDWGTPVEGGKWGACHGIDRPFVFDNVEIAHAMFGEHTAEAQRMADQLSDTWIAFARHGNPNNAAIPDWPEYDLSNRATMIFNQESGIENDPEADERKYFAQQPPSLSQ